MSEKILIIDDDVEFANLLGLLLTRKGYETQMTFGGVEALEAVEKMDPSIILQDFMLPDYRGMELLADLKKKCPAAYIIIITARGSEEVAVELMKSGAADYLKKPFEAEKLLTTIQNTLKLKASETERDRLYTELSRQNLELMAFNAFSNALTSSMTAEEKCKSALGIVAKNMRVDLVTLFQTVNGGRTLNLVASEGSGIEGIKECALDKDTGIASYVADIKKPAIVSDFKNEKRFKVPAKLNEIGMTSALGVPMMLGDQMVGVLAVYSKEPRSFMSFDMKLMGSFANQIAVSLENVKITAKLERARRRWQTTVDAVPDRVTLQDASHTVLMANKAAAEMAGTSVKDLVGQKCCWIFHNSKEPIHDCPVAEAIRTKQMAYREMTVDSPPGTFQVWAHPIVGNDGNIESVVEYARKVKG